MDTPYAEGPVVLVRTWDETVEQWVNSCFPIQSVYPMTHGNFHHAMLLEDVDLVREGPFSLVKHWNVEYAIIPADVGDYCLLFPKGSIQTDYSPANPHAYAVRFLPPMREKAYRYVRASRTKVGTCGYSFSESWSEDGETPDWVSLGLITSEKQHADIMASYPVVYDSNPKIPAMFKMNPRKSEVTVSDASDSHTLPDRYTYPPERPDTQGGSSWLCYRGFGVSATTTTLDEKKQVVSITGVKPPGGDAYIYRYKLKVENSRKYAYVGTCVMSCSWPGSSYPFTFMYPSRVGKMRCEVSVKSSYHTNGVPSIPSGSVEHCRLRFYNMLPDENNIGLEESSHELVYEVSGEKSGAYKNHAFEFMPKMFLDELNGVGYGMLCIRAECGHNEGILFQCTGLKFTVFGKDGEEMPETPAPYGP